MHVSRARHTSKHKLPIVFKVNKKLFHYSAIPYSAFYRLLSSNVSGTVCERNCSC